MAPSEGPKGPKGGAHRRHRLLVIDEPPENAATVFDFTKPGSQLTGAGTVDLVCGHCDFVVGPGAAGQVRNIVIRCPECRSYNQA